MDIADKILLTWAVIGTVLVLIAIYRYFFKTHSVESEDLQSIIDEKDKVISGQHELINSQKDMIAEMLLELKR